MTNERARTSAGWDPPFRGGGRCPPRGRSGHQNSAPWVSSSEAPSPKGHFFYCPGFISSAWDEAAITWNNEPAMGGGPPCIDISATSGQVSWNVTNVVQNTVSGLTTNNGFYLTRENDTTDPQDPQAKA